VHNRREPDASHLASVVQEPAGDESGRNEVKADRETGLDKVHRDEVVEVEQRGLEADEGVGDGGGDDTDINESGKDDNVPGAIPYDPRSP
jgi:hypothetical protein